MLHAFSLINPTMIAVVVAGALIKMGVDKTTGMSLSPLNSQSCLLYPISFPSFATQS